MTKYKQLRFFNCQIYFTTNSFSFPIMFLFWVLINLIAYGTCLAEEDKKNSHFLYINSYHPGYSWSDGIEKGLRESFEASGKKFELSLEYLDTRRFTNPTLLNKQAETILTKYKDFHHDLIILSDNAAFNFTLRNRERLFPDIPIVFCGYNNFRPEMLNGLTNITGVNEEIDVDGLIEAALSVQPNIRTLAFILSTGDVSNRPIAEKVETSIVPKYQDQYEITILKDAPMSQIKKTLARLPDESALFLIGQTSDMGNGRALTPVENGRLISAASPVPIYTLWDFHLDTGVLGGRIITGYDQGKTAGDMALQILNGEKAANIPILMESPSSYFFDYTVMKRFNISMDNLPENSTVINKPKSFYEVHKKLVWTISIIITALSVFIVILSLNILRRMRAEKALKEAHDGLEKKVRGRTIELRKINKELNKEIDQRKHIETTLRESQLRYRELFENINSGVAVYEVKDDGKDFIFKDFNRAGEKIDNEKREHLIGQSILKVRPGVEEFGLIDAFRHVWETGEPVHHPISQYEDNHLKGWYENYIYRLPSNEIVAVFENITERKQIEEELQKLSIAIRQSPVSIVITDLEANIEYVNPTFCKLTGYSEKEVIGLNPRILQSSNTLKETYQQLWETVISGKKWYGEFHNKKKNGALYWEKVVISPILNENGDVTHFLGIKEDITDQRQIEEALRQSEEKFKNLVENSNDWIWEINTEGIYTYSSPLVEKMLGYKPEEIIGKTPFDLMPPEEAMRLSKIFKDILEKGEAIVSLENINQHKDGRLIVLETSGVPVSDNAGNVTHYRGVDRDITKRKQAEERREKLINELQEALENIKTLSGLLPICASCKNIRDDKGYWNQIESYIQKHSDAEFSHGVCPECSDKLYGDEDWYIEMKKEKGIE